MFLLKQVLPSAVLAFAFAAVISGIALLWRSEGARGVLPVLAVALGYAAGHFWTAGLTKIPPVDTTNWLPYFGVAMMVAVVPIYAPRFRALRWVALGVIAACALRLLLAPMFRNTWPSGTGWAWVVCLAGATLLLALCWDAVAGRATPIELPLYLLAVIAGTAGALILSGSLLLGQFAIVLAGAVAGAAIPSFRGVAPPTGAIAVLSLLHAALLACGYFFAELPAICAAMLAFAPALVLIPSRMRPSFKRLLLRLTLVCAPVIAALFLAFRSSPPLDY